MKPKHLKNLLLSEINSVSKRADVFSFDSGNFFTRKRKLPFETVVKTIIGMESKSLTNEIIDAFEAEPGMPTASAFVQQRCKIKPESFKTIFDGFTSKLVSKKDDELRILAIDGSDVQIATNPNDISSYHPGANGQKPYNLLHLNALFDLTHKIYTDSVIQGRMDLNEHSALQEMVDRSSIKKALVIVDRGYESYNNMAHIKEKGWYFLIRIKDGVNGIKSGLELPACDVFDVPISLKLSRKQTNEMKERYIKDKNHYKFIPHSTPFDYLDIKYNRQRTAWNVEYIKQPIKEAYDQLFGEAIAEYNAKQKRKDRQVTDYLKDIKNFGNGEKQFYEIVVQIGKKDDTGVLDSEGNLSVDAKAASEILDEYARSFQERNPNLYLFNAVLHMDEATPHLHLDYIPVAHGYKTKMHTRNSLTKALQEMGIEPAVSKTDNETTHWQEREREYLKGLCLERGIEVEILGVKRDNYTIPEYKAAMQATEQLTAELEILNAEKQEAESVIASVGAEIADAREEVEESKKHLDEINEQIADRKKRYAIYEKKIDKVLAAGKPVAKELAVIRKNVKQLPSILGSEPSVKISEKDFNRLMDMAQASGTLEKLNEIYDRDLEHMQGIIDDLMAQVNTWKDKVLHYDKFLNVKGLFEQFKEFARTKSIKERMEDKQKTQKQEQKMKPVQRRKKDIAI